MSSYLTLTLDIGSFPNIIRNPHSMGITDCYCRRGVYKMLRRVIDTHGPVKR